MFDQRLDDLAADYHEAQWNKYVERCDKLGVCPVCGNEYVLDDEDEEAPACECDPRWGEDES